MEPENENENGPAMKVLEPLSVLKLPLLLRWLPLGVRWDHPWGVNMGKAGFEDLEWVGSQLQRVLPLRSYSVETLSHFPNRRSYTLLPSSSGPSEMYRPAVMISFISTSSHPQTRDIPPTHPPSPSSPATS